jgi:hypothetical protein
VAGGWSPAGCCGRFWLPSVAFRGGGRAGWPLPQAGTECDGLRGGFVPVASRCCCCACRYARAAGTRLGQGLLMSPSLPGVPVARSVSHARARSRGRRPGRAGLPRRRAGRSVRREPAGMLRRGPGPAGPARDPAFPSLRAGAVHGGGAVRAHRDRGRDRVGARRPAGGPDSGRGEAERAGRAGGAAPGDRGADLHCAGRAGRRASCRGVPGPPRASRPGHVSPGRAGVAARDRGGRQGGPRRGRGRRPHPVPAGRRHPRQRPGARRTADRPEDERGPGVRAAAAGTERVLPAGRVRHHRRRRAHRLRPRQAHQQARRALRAP